LEKEIEISYPFIVKKIEQLKKTIQAIGGTQFISLMYRSKGDGKLARYTINVGRNYDTVVRESHNMLMEMYPKLNGEEKVAASELLRSFEATLDGHDKEEANPSYTLAEHYQNLGNGVKYNPDTDNTLLVGYVSSSEVLEEGDKKKKKNVSVKDKLREQLPIGKYRSFRINTDNIINGQVSGKFFEVKHQ